MTQSFDVVIVGGGLVGMSLAASLQGSALAVLQIEAQAPLPIEQRWDERHFALGKASIERLQALGAWSATLEETPIREVHVSRAGEFGRVLLRAGDMGLQAFGATAPARLLVSALEQRVSQCSGVQRWRPARLNGFVAGADSVELQLSGDADTDTKTVRCRLLVAADGTESTIRSAAGIAVQRHDYHQTAVVCTAETEKPHQGRAFERFTDDGPVALLPLTGNRCGVVCTLSEGAARIAEAMSDAEYAHLLQQRFGHRLGRITRVGRRQLWPLRLTLAERLVDHRVVVIGNAAQTIHPIGAQGFNLGLRDASTLADHLRNAKDPGAAEVLQAYADARVADRDQTINMSNAMLRLSTATGPLSQGLRAIGMALIDRVPMLAQGIARAAMGYRERAA
jgi:2-octaprenyl-6-methoxyphenol hydroxylase